MRKLSLLVDGVVYGFQRHGGINRFFNEVLSRLSQRTDVSIAVLLPHHCEGKLPTMTAQVWQPPFPEATGLSWKFDQVARPLLRKANALVAKSRLRQFSQGEWPYVFQSTYFTLSAETVPQVAVVHDMNHEIFSEFYQNNWGKWLRRQYIDYVRQATRVIAVSQTTKNHIVHIYGIPSEKIDVVHHAVNRDIFRPEHSDEILQAQQAAVGGYEPYILYVGSRSMYKNFPRLLNGFAEASTKKRLNLVVAGNQWEFEEMQRIKDLGLESLVRLVVNPPDRLLAALYKSALAFIYPSLGEGFGIPLLEAMACETMVLASDIPVFREVAGEAAMYFDPYQPNDIARALENATSDSARTGYISRGTQQVAMYSWEKCAEQICDVYWKALETWNDNHKR